MRASRSLFQKAVKEVYTHGHHESVVSQHAKRSTETSARFLTSSGILDKDTTKLLDVGCGPGSITAGLGKLCKSVIGVDAVPEVLEHARSELVKQGVDNVQIQHANVYELPFKDNEFDVVYAHQVLQHLVDPVAALKEMTRVVRPGGHVAVRESDYRSFQVHPPLPEIDEWRRIYRATCRHNKAEPDAGSWLLRWMLDAGYQDDDVKLSMSVMQHVTRQQCIDWGMAWKRRALESDFARQAVQYGIASEEELKAISDGWEKWGKSPDALFYYICVEAISTKK